MKKILQLVLVFSEIFILSSCLLIRQYHYISNPLNWTEAQTYCRQNYIDLATIESSEEMDKFLKAIERPTELESTVKTNSRYGDFWIGLNNEINWKWSDGFSGGITADNYWTSEDQYHSRTDQICLTTSKTNRLSDFDCDSLLTFICYDETLQNTPKYIFVNETMNWSSAQRFCRQNFTDLVTVENEQVWVGVNNVASDTQNSWIGLYRDSNISWSDGSSFFPNKIPFPLLLWPNNNRCGFYLELDNNRWRFAPCTNKYAFVCYSVEPVKHSLKLRLKINSPVNLNDPAVKAELLKKFQTELTDKGVSGVKLKWTEQRDGNVFKKEESKTNSAL